MLRVTLEQWRAFVATAEHGSFQKAADHLNKTQSAVAHAIRKMEGALGQQLFDLSSRHARISHVGTMLLPHAHRLIEDAQQVEQLCRATCVECREGLGEMPIAVSPVFPFDLLLAAVSDLDRLFPDLSIKIHEASGARAAALLADGRVRIAICEMLDDSMPTEPVLLVPLLCVVSAAHPLAARPSVTPEDLRDCREIQIRQASCHPLSGRARRRWSVGQMAAALALLHRQEGYAWLPQHGVRKDLDSGTLVALPVPATMRHAVPLTINHRGYEEDCDVALTFVSILRDVISE